jgi:hypothetical protein
MQQLYAKSVDRHRFRAPDELLGPLDEPPPEDRLLLADERELPPDGRLLPAEERELLPVDRVPPIERVCGAEYRPGLLPYELDGRGDDPR